MDCLCDLSEGNIKEEERDVDGGLLIRTVVVESASGKRDRSLWIGAAAHVQCNLSYSFCASREKRTFSSFSSQGSAIETVADADVGVDPWIMLMINSRSHTCLYSNCDNRIVHMMQLSSPQSRLSDPMNSTLIV